MTVRHKHQAMNPNVPSYTLIEESQHYYLVEYCSQVKALSKADYEPVPEIRWMDISSECVIASYSGAIWHETANAKTHLGVLKPGYHLRKVRACLQEEGQPWFHGDAFLIEQQEPA